MMLKAFREKGARFESLDCVAIFHSIHDVMKAEKLLKSARIEREVVPVPREISSDCGMAVRFRCGDKGRVERALDAKGVDVSGFFRIEGKRYQPCG
jgi:hypothetical protein